MKKLILVSVLAFVSAIALPVATFVISNSNSNGTVQAIENPSQESMDATEDEALDWGEAVLKWCKEDGYSEEDCLDTWHRFVSELHRYLALSRDGVTVVGPDPRTEYMRWYPDQDKGPSSTSPNMYGTVHPGSVASPPPRIPSRNPSIICACHERDGVWGGVYAYNINSLTAKSINA